MFYGVVEGVVDIKVVIWVVWLCFIVLERRKFVSWEVYRDIWEKRMCNFNFVLIIYVIGLV